MAAEWEEVKRLAADFQRAQLSSTVQRLSERNCIEIVKKLLDIKLIDVIFTSDGKEYITPQHILKEIRDELIVHGGRINLVDLSQILNIDFSHIETKASELAKSDPDLRLILGQLISSEYLDTLGEEINEKLQQAGHITVGELTKQYDLPGDFLEQCVHERLGTIIQGQADPYDTRTLFTEAYVAQHKARIRGVLSAVTRPVPVISLINHFKFPERLFYTVAEELIKEDWLAGNLTGGHSEKTVYIPDIYAKSQNEWVDAFLKQNGYLEYDSLSRLGIPDPKAYVTRRFKEQNLSFLCSCCCGQEILNQVEAAVEEALNSSSWIDVMPLLPSVFTKDDAQQVMKSVLKKTVKSTCKMQIFCDTIIVSDAFIQESMTAFDPLLTMKAEEDTQKGIHIFEGTQSFKPVISKNDKSEDLGKTKQDKKDERRKKAAGGKSGGGCQGRETKTRSVKKKQRGGRGGGDDSGSEEESSVTSLRKGGRQQELEFMDTKEIMEQLGQIDAFHECPDELLNEIAGYLLRPLTKKYQEIAKSVFLASQAASSATRRKTHAELQEKLNTLLNHVYMFEKGTKVFTGDIQLQLIKHLLKTMCTEITNMVVTYLAEEYGLSSEVDINTSITPEARQKVIGNFPENVKEPLTQLHGTLNAKTVEDFQKQIDVVLGPGICDMIIRKVDKKKERQVAAAHRQSLLSQLSETTDSALCLHLAVLLIFQAQTHCMLHASGKFVPHIISYFQKHIPLEDYQILGECQELVIKQLKHGDKEEQEEETEMTSKLDEVIANVKEMAITFRKTSQSEA